MESVGWLKIDDAGRVHVPNYDHHLSKSAKTRASEQRKKTRQRSKRDDNGTNVPAATGQKRGQSRDQRREEVLSSDEQNPASLKESEAQAIEPIKEEKTLSAQKKAFSQFWSVYPEKGGKQAAEKAFCRVWTKLAKDMGQEAATSKLVEAAADYRAFITGHPSPPKTKYAQGWLNDARYEDDFIEMLDAARWSAPQTKAGQRDQRTKEVLDGIFGSDEPEQRGGDAAGIGWIDGSVSSGAN
jgi:hypothetical protein